MISTIRLEEIQDCMVANFRGFFEKPTLEWFKNPENFNCGFSRFKDDYGMNWIDIDGKILSSERYLKNGIFVENFASFKDSLGWNWVDTHGNVLSNKRYKDFAGFFVDGFALFRVGQKQGFVNWLGIEFKHDLFDFSSFSWEKTAEDNKLILKNMETLFYKNLKTSKGSLKEYILREML